MDDKDYREVAEETKLETIEIHDKGVTTEKVAERLAEALDAEEVKVFNSQGDIIYSDPLTAHNIRLKALDIATELLEIKPGQKLDVSHSVEGESMADFVAKYEELKRIERENTGTGD